MKTITPRRLGFILAAAVLALAGQSQVWAQAQSLYNRQSPLAGQTNNLLPQTRGNTSGAGSLNNSQSANRIQTESSIQRGNFVGQDDQGAFVGMDPNLRSGGQANNRNSRNRQGSNNRRRNSGFQFNGFGNNGFGNNGQRGRGDQNTQQRRPVRPRQRVGFDYQAPSNSQIVLALRTQFTSYADHYPTLGNVTVLEENGRIELYGEVDSVERRRLAEVLARLEPGVNEVVNRLTVQSP